MDIKENDWKCFKKNIGNWQENYIRKLNLEYIDILNSDLPASEKFWTLENRIKNDKNSKGVIIDMRRSTAVNNILALLFDGVISLDDLTDFSLDLQNTIKHLYGGVKNYPVDDF